MMTRPYLTKRLLMGRKESNQTNKKQTNRQFLRCIYTNFKLEIPIVFRHVVNLSKSTHIFVSFTIELIGNKMGHLLKCLMLYRHFINISET